MTDIEDQAFQAGQMELAKEIETTFRIFRKGELKKYTPIFKMGFNQAEILVQRVLKIGLK